MLKQAVLGTSLLVISLPILADSSYKAELLLGVANQETSSNVTTTTEGSDTSMGIRLSYVANQNLAIELAYQDYGVAEDSFRDSFGDDITDKFETTAITLGVKGILPLENRVSLNARLGLSNWDLDLEETDSAFPGEVFKLSDDGTDLYYGIGADYQLNQQLSISTAYTITRADVSFLGVLDADHDITNFELSLGYTF